VREKSAGAEGQKGGVLGAGADAYLALLFVPSLPVSLVPDDTLAPPAMSIGVWGVVHELFGAECRRLS
jgi:hypothetical protein